MKKIPTHPTHSWFLFLILLLLMAGCGVRDGGGADNGDHNSLSSHVDVGTNRQGTSSGIEEGSPFGFHPAEVSKQGYQDNGYTDALHIGVRFTRPSLYALWSVIQPDLAVNAFDFSLNDDEYGKVPTDISIIANISPQARMDQGRCLPGSWLPIDEAQYAAFVKATVERYDGDGLEDMPGLLNPIKYWQVGNEPTNDNRSDFAGLQMITYQAVKQVCPDCKVLIGGATGFPYNYIWEFDQFYAPILAELGGQYVDIFDFHWYGNALGEYRLRETAGGKDVLDHIRSTLTTDGFPSDIPIWITEMGAYSGSPTDEQPMQTEAQQAGDYFKRFIYPLSRGVDKVFPAFGLMEGFKNQDSYFDHTGLIYDGEGSNDLGLGIKKLGYYTYQKMTEKLGDADWSSLTILHEGTESEHVYVFRIEKNSLPIYIAWWDDFDEPGYLPGDTKSLTLTGLTGTTITATEIVPAAEFGRNLSDDDQAFAMKTYPVSGGSADILLSESPVILEGK